MFHCIVNVCYIFSWSADVHRIASHINSFDQYFIAFGCEKFRCCCFLFHFHIGIPSFESHSSVLSNQYIEWVKIKIEILSFSLSFDQFQCINRDIFTTKCIKLVSISLISKNEYVPLILELFWRHFIQVHNIKAMQIYNKYFIFILSNKVVTVLDFKSISIADCFEFFCWVCFCLSFSEHLMFDSENDLLCILFGLFVIRSTI